MRVLVVGNPTSPQAQLRAVLRQECVRVDEAGDAAAALHCAAEQPDFDAIVMLDAPAGEMSAAEFCGALRRSHVTAPIVIVADLDAEEVVAALDAGADAHVPSQAGAHEIVARLRAVVRRARGAAVRLRCGDVSIELPSRLVRRNGELVALTAREFDLLELLARNCDRVVPRSLLRERIWGQGPLATDVNVVDVYVSRLRRKLGSGNGDAERVIRTIPGTGYMLLSEPAGTAA